MSIGRVLGIAFLPAAGTVIFLGIVVLMALIQFVVIEPQAVSKVAAYALGYMFLALSLKLILGAVFGVFVETAGDALPRGAMLLLALVLTASGMFLLAPLLSEYAV